MDEMKLMKGLREITSKYPFEVIVFNPMFFMFDQYAEVFDSTIKCCTLCTVIMSFIILIFIPKKICVLWVTLTVISVEVGVIGLMPFFGINLDGISMIVLIVGIGFSVDYSAHVSYHYLALEGEKTQSERLAHCLYALGPPVLQSAATTILGVLPLLLHGSYISNTFSLMVILVISLALLHSLLLLPILLSVFGSSSGEVSKQASSSFVYQKYVVGDATTTESNNNISEKDPGVFRVSSEKHGKECGNNIDVVNRNDLDNSKLHNEFFQPIEEKQEVVNKEILENCRFRFKSDSSYYSYQNRHLRRHVKQVVPQRHSIDSVSNINQFERKDRPSKFDIIQGNIRRVQSKKSLLSQINHMEKGVENEGFEDSVLNRSSTSTFKPEVVKTPGQEEAANICSNKKKIVFVDHEMYCGEEQEVFHTDSESESLVI